MKKQYIYSILITLGLATMAFGRNVESADLDRLVAHYLEMQTAMAGDDLKATVAAGGQFSKALADLNEDGVHLHDLMGPAKTIASAKNIKSARDAFLPLSNAMVKLVKHHGVSGEQELFVAHCPMAFGGKGGDWIQGDDKVLNPYWGARMLHCGGIKEQIAGGTMESRDGHAHGH